MMNVCYHIGGQWTTWFSIVFWAATWIVGHSAHAGADTPVWLSLMDVQQDNQGDDSNAHDKRIIWNGKFIRSRTIMSY